MELNASLVVNKFMEVFIAFLTPVNKFTKVNKVTELYPCL